MEKYNRFLYYIEYNKIESKKFADFLLPYKQYPTYSPIIEQTKNDIESFSNTDSTFLEFYKKSIRISSDIQINTSYQAQLDQSEEQLQFWRKVATVKNLINVEEQQEKKIINEQQFAQNSQQQIRSSCNNYE